MARSEFNFTFTKTFEQANAEIEGILKSNGYHVKDYNGESVWKKGTGLMTAMQYIKLEFAEQSVTVYGWVQAGVGNVGGNEMSLNGFVGCIPKKAVLKVIKKIEACLS